MLLSAAGCKRHGDDAMKETKFPGMVSAGGGTSGQVMARSSKPKTDATYAGGTPGIAGGAGGNNAGAGMGGSTRETGQGPSSGVTPPSNGTAAASGATQKPSGDSGNNPVKPDATPAPAPAAAHRDPGHSAAPGR
jgi:hypothetical protein